MSLFLDIGTGAGLSSATGVRPDFSFLESTGFLAAVVVVGVVAFLVERSGTNREGRGPAEILAGVLGLALGGLLFAGALADNGHDAWVGLVFGPLCAALGWLAIGGLIERVRARLAPDQDALLTAYADGAALLLAAIAVFVPPVALLAIPAFVVLLAGGRRREGQKYAGLRILR